MEKEGKADGAQVEDAGAQSMSACVDEPTEETNRAESLPAMGKQEVSNATDVKATLTQV